jgi:hypothetical protein
MRPEFAALLTHKIILYKRDRNVAGDFTVVATYADIEAFVQFGRLLTTNLQNEVVEARAIVFLPDTAPIDVSHEHWLIDQTCPYERNNLEVIRIDPIDDPLNGGATHHYEVAVR